MTVTLGVVPFAAAQRASFLGKDVSSVAAGIVGFYPGSAAAEVARVAALTLGFWFAVGFVAAKAAESWSGWRRWMLFPLAPLLAYSTWWWAAALKYPALFEGFLPDAGQRLLFRASFWLSPNALFGLGWVLFALPLLLAVAGLPRRQLFTLAQVAAVQGILALAVLPIRGATARAAQKPVNILVIGIDSLRTDRLTKAEVTPELRALLRDPQAVSFEDHYVGIPRTFPSWIEMLTGRYAARTGIRHMFPGFGDRQGVFDGMVTSLKGKGYRTEAVSDFAGDIFPRFEAGFDSVHAPKLTLMTMIRLSVDQSFPAFLPLLVTEPFRGFFPALKQSPAFGDPEHLGSLVMERIHASEEKPWLLTVFFSTAHFPYAAPFPYYSKFADRNYDGAFRFDKNPESGGGEQGPPSADVTQARALYDGAVRAVDSELGKVFADLKASGLWDSTLIVVTADHGEDLYENGLLQGHGEHLRGENVLKVPFVLKLPSSVKPIGPRMAFTTRSIDLASTVLGAAGEAAPVGDGIDLTPYATGAKAGSPNLAAFSETEIWFARGGPGFFQKKRLDYPGISGLLSFDQGYSGEIVLNPLYEKLIVTAKHRMMIVGDYKIIYMPTERGVEFELYNRRVDPANLHDLAATEPARLGELKQKLLAFLQTEESPKAQLVNGFVVPE